MPVAVSFNLRIGSSAYRVSRGPAPPEPLSSLSLPSALALVCAWVVLPASVGSAHPACRDSDYRQKAGSCLEPLEHRVRRRYGLWRCQKGTPPDDLANVLQRAGLPGFAAATPCVCSATIRFLGFKQFATLSGCIAIWFTGLFMERGICWHSNVAARCEIFGYHG